MYCKCTRTYACILHVCMCIYVYVGREQYASHKVGMWSEEYSTPEEDTNSKYILARRMLRIH